MELRGGGMFGTAIGTRALIARSRSSIAASRLLVVTSRDTLDGVQSGRPLLRGAWGHRDNADGAVDLRGRVVRLLTTLSQEEPKIFAGPSHGSACDICGQGIVRGAIEYEAEFTALALRFDRSCFALWQNKVAKH